MIKEGKFRIHVSINGVKMPLTIKREDEILYRDAEKMTKHYIEKFRKNFAQKTSEEILTITAYQIAVTAIKLQSENNIDSLAKKVEKLNNQLKKELFKDN